MLFVSFWFHMLMKNFQTIFNKCNFNDSKTSQVYRNIFRGEKGLEMFSKVIFFLQILLMNNSKCWGVAPHDKLMISQTI